MKKEYESELKYIGYIVKENMNLMQLQFYILI